MDTWPTTLPSPSVNYEDVDANGKLLENDILYPVQNRYYPDKTISAVFHLTPAQLSTWRTFFTGEPQFTADWISTLGFTDHYARMENFSGMMVTPSLWRITAQFTISYLGAGLWA